LHHLLVERQHSRRHVGMRHSSERSLPHGIHRREFRYLLSLAITRTGFRDRISTAARRDSTVEIALTIVPAPVPLRAMVAAALMAFCASSMPPSIASARIGSSWCTAPQDLADHRFDGEDLGSKCVGVPVKAFRQYRSLETTPSPARRLAVSKAGSRGRDAGRLNS
jgi:hypothetical protein